MLQPILKAALRWRWQASANQEIGLLLQANSQSRAIVRLFLIFLNLIWAFATPAMANPLPNGEAFRLNVSLSEGGDLQLRWNIAEGYYLYRDHMEASDGSGREIVVHTVSGLQKNDPNFGSIEVYYTQASATIAAPGKAPISLTYQGCQEDGICYRPETRTIDPVSLSISNAPAQGGIATSMWNAGIQPASSGTTPSPAPGTFELANDQGLVSSLLASGGALWVIASFLLFGLLLAFTPCVFPVYPILAGALTRRGEQLTPRRGFVLSTIYAVSLATAFGLVGAVAGWSGQNLHMALQSQYTAAFVALIFVVLALSMFGLFELQLPSSWTIWISGKTEGRGASKRSVAVLGFSSALIVGPCVTAPLAGALLYIAQTGNVLLGAAALFTLGLGKSIPLIILGTFGGKMLPRAGAWMEAVKHLFGFGFIASAIWMATPLLPERADLVLWASLLMGFAVTCHASTSNGHRLAVVKTLGVMSFVYGVILIIGAASGAIDPLKPLSVLSSRATSATATKLSFMSAASAPDLQAALTAVGGLKPTAVYFTADWCVSCRVVERTVLADEVVRRALDDFDLVKADVSKLDAGNQQLMDQLQVVGPPTVVFFDKMAREKPGTRLVGNVSIGNLAASALATQGP